MILYSVTPNPALDLSGTVPTLIPDEKNYVSEMRKDPGGNGINASRIAARLKTRTQAMGFLGGPTGTALKGLLKKEKIDAHFTPIGEETRTNVTVTRTDQHQQTRLTFPGPKISIGERKKLLLKLNSLKTPGILAIGGSLPEGVPPTFHLQLIRAVKTQKIGILVDVPSKFLSPLTLALFQKKKTPPLLLLKPNEHELEEWSGRKLLSLDDMIQAAQPLLDTFAVVCLSLGKKGALWITRRWVIQGTPPPIQAKGSVGAGDSMVGAICSRLISAQCVTPADLLAAPRSVHEEALRWGLAAGSATAEVTGTELAHAQEIRRLVPQVRLGDVALPC